MIWVGKIKEWIKVGGYAVMFLLAKLRQKYQQQQKKSAWSIG